MKQSEKCKDRTAGSRGGNGGIKRKWERAGNERNEGEKWEGCRAMLLEVAAEEAEWSVRRIKIS